MRTIVKRVGWITLGTIVTAAVWSAGFASGGDRSTDTAPRAVPVLLSHNTKSTALSDRSSRLQPASRLSISGDFAAVDPSTLTANERANLAGTAAEDPVSITELRPTGGFRFYLLEARTGNTCISVSRATTPERLQIVACPDDFPSGQRPMVVVPEQATYKNGSVATTAVWGIAADAVATVKITLADGSSSDVPLEGNTFEYTPPAGAQLRSIVAYDPQGHSIALQIGP